MEILGAGGDQQVQGLGRGERPLCAGARGAGSQGHGQVPDAPAAGRGQLQATQAPGKCGEGLPLALFGFLILKPLRVT